MEHRIHVSNSTYQVGATTYTQRKLVLGQVEHLVRLVAGLTITGSPADILRALGDRLSSVLACVLIPEGQTAADVVRALDAGTATTQIRESLEWDMAAQVIEDFFGVNQASLLPDLLRRVNERVRAAMTGISSPTTPISPEAISPNGRASVAA